MPEAGVIYPGMIIVATDSHTTTHGAFGALGTGCGATDMATILMNGELWLRVPEVIEVMLEGDAAKGVFPKDVVLEDVVLEDVVLEDVVLEDVVLEVLGKVKADGAVKLNQGYIGSCTGGREEDIAVAAKILRGKKNS